MSTLSGRRRGAASSPSGTDDAGTRALAAELRREVRGEVRFDAGSRALYATDASNYRQPPIGVVVPRDSDDVIRALAVCRRHDVPILGRGAGTSLAGQACNVAVVFDFSKYMHHVLDVDPVGRTARVQPGCVLDDLQAAAAEYGLTFGPDPATHSRCTLGGMIGNNSCGVHSVMAENYGPGPRTEHNVEALVVLTYDGEVMKVGPTGGELLRTILEAGGRRATIYRRLRELRERYAAHIRHGYPDIPRRVSGYNLPQLLDENGFNVARALVGTESTCVIVLEATVTLIPAPRKRALLVLGYPDVYSAADHVPEVLDAKPIGLEGLDRRLIGFMEKKALHLDDLALIPDGGGFLLVEFGGETRDQASQAAQALKRRLAARPDAPRMKLYDSEAQQQRVWDIRESGLGATAWVPGEAPGWPGWEDAAVPPDRVGDYLRDFRRLLDRYGYDSALYGHFGQGCIHGRIDFDLTSAEGIASWRRFLDEAADLVVSYGGSLSGEHGDGQARAALLPRMFGPELMKAFAEFKAIWDPTGRMNPGKLVNADAPDRNLRLGADFRPAVVGTRFEFPADVGSFQNAALRCVGVGTCRRHEGGTMCPSYRVTREEMHSTRGRARLLFEMLRGDVIRDGWKSEEVREALDLCLACKACKHECPVQVDMATYKAEFQSHYYEGRLRPRPFFAFGLIHWWARLATLAPGFTNRVIRAPVLSSLLKRAGGIAAERELPAFARRTFREWFGGRERHHMDRPRVILWPDTFNNHFHPDTARAAVDVLEAAGFQVTIPARSLCCGRPLYDWGALGLARHLLRQTLDTLRPDIRAGVPLVGLEPSCVSVFRDELLNLFPDDEDARRLSRQSYMLSEFLEQRAADFQLPTLSRQALVHGHCHHTSVLDFGAERRVLGAMGLSCDYPEEGCCGMAGAFGFEADKLGVSRAIGEQALLPAVRQAPGDTLILADGFSCREQVRQSTDRRALHLAEVVQLGLQQDGRLPPPAEEKRGTGERDPRGTGLLLATGLGLAAGLLLTRAMSRGRSG